MRTGACSAGHQKKNPGVELDLGNIKWKVKGGKKKAKHLVRVPSSNDTSKK